MSPENLVASLRRIVITAAVEDLTRQLEKPPGRRPAPEHVQRSDWYNRLSEDDRAVVRAIVADAAEATMFGALCVLDGARAVHPPSEGRLELSFVSSESKTLLTASDGAGVALHELL